MKNLFSFGILLFLVNVLFAQNIEWQKSFGGDSTDYANDILQTTDGGYIMVGSSTSIEGDVTGNHGSSDAWIVKLDSSGNLAWQKCLGGSGWDEANAIQQTTDGGYIVAGYSNSLDGDVTGIHGSDDYWVVKLTANGTLAWQKCFGGHDQDRAYSIQQTTDGGYIVAGWSSSYDGQVIGNHGSDDFWIVKLDSSGNLSWQKSLGGSGRDWAFSIQQTTDGGYIVVGYSYSTDEEVTGNHGNGDSWIVKLAANGNLSWQKCLGGSEDDGAFSIQQTTDGGYIVAGTSYSTDGEVTGNHGLSDYWIVKLTINGNLSWQKNFGGSNYDEAYSVEQTIDGGYIVGGYSESMDGEVTGNHGGDYWIVKLAANGTLSWQKCLGGSSTEEAYAIQQTTDGGYIVAGLSCSNDGDVSGNHEFCDVWVVKLKNFGVGIEENSVVTALSVSPNPVVGNSMKVDYYLSATTDVEISIVDVLGKHVGYVERGIEGEQSRVMAVEGLASGLYFLEIRTQYGRESVRWVKE